MNAEKHTHQILRGKPLRKKKSLVKENALIKEDYNRGKVMTREQTQKYSFKDKINHTLSLQIS